MILHVGVVLSQVPKSGPGATSMGANASGEIQAVKDLEHVVRLHVFVLVPGVDLLELRFKLAGGEIRANAP